MSTRHACPRSRWRTRRRYWRESAGFRKSRYAAPTSPPKRAPPIEEYKQAQLSLPRFPLEPVFQGAHARFPPPFPQLAATKACEWRRAEAAISELKDLLQTQVRRNPPDASALNPLIAGTVRDLEHATLARVEQERAATRDSIAKASIAYATRVPIPNTGVQSFPGGRSQSVPRPDVPTRHPARDALVQAPKTQRLSPQSASPQHSGAVHPAKAPRHDWATCTRHRGGTAGSDDDDDDVCAIREPPNMGGPQGSHKIFSKKQRGGGGGDANWERGRGGVETAGRGSGDAPRREQQMGGFVSAGVRLDSENKRKGLPPVRRDSGDAAGGNGGGNGNAITRNGFVPPYVRKAFAGPSSGNGGGGGNSNGNGTGNGQAQRKQTTGQNTANDGKADEPPFCEQVMRRLSPNGEPIPDVLLKMEREIVEKVVAEILEGNSSVEWDSIAGLEHAKAAVQELAVWPLLKPELFRGARSVPRGLLLFGPPGTGKTLIGRAVASQCNATFFSISASSLTSKWIGEGEKMVKALFAVANCCEPAVIFVDEIDSLLSSRKAEGEHESSRRMKTEFLVQMDGLSGDEGRVLMIGATNRPQELDDGARRRLAKQLCTCWGFLKARHAVYRPVRDYLLRTTGNSYQYCGQLTQYHGTLSNPSYKFQTWPEGLTLFVHKNRHSPSLRESAARDDAEHFERGERGGARLERQRPKHDLRENARVFRVRYETPNSRSREGAVAGTVSKQRQGKFAKFAKRQPIAQRHAAHNALGFQARFEASPAERDAGGYRVPRTLEFRARRDEWEGGGRGRGRGVVDFVFFFATTTSTMKLFTFYFKAVTTPAAPL